jgi:hypothetical protein
MMPGNGLRSLTMKSAMVFLAGVACTQTGFCSGAQSSTSVDDEVELQVRLSDGYHIRGQDLLVSLILKNDSGKEIRHVPVRLWESWDVVRFEVREIESGESARSGPSVGQRWEVTAEDYTEVVKPAQQAAFDVNLSRFVGGLNLLEGKRYRLRVRLNISGVSSEVVDGMAEFTVADLSNAIMRERSFTVEPGREREGHAAIAVTVRKIRQGSDCLLIVQMRLDTEHPRAVVIGRMQEAAGFTAGLDPNGLIQIVYEEGEVLRRVVFDAWNVRLEER